MAAGLLLTVGPAVRWAWAGADDEAAASQLGPGSAAVSTPSAATSPLPGPNGIPTAAATPPAAASSQPAAAPTQAAQPTVVPESRPLLLEAPEIGLTADVSPYSAADVRRNGGVVKPPSLWDVSWWTGGGTPGTGAQNTVYLYGHTWKEPAVFNRLKELETGDEVYVTTAAGRLRYVVEGSFTVSKPRLPTHEEVTAVVPGRLLLLGCYRETGLEDYTTRNIVVTAQLSPAR